MGKFNGSGSVEKRVCGYGHWIRRTFLFFNRLGTTKPLLSFFTERSLFLWLANARNVRWQAVSHSLSLYPGCGSSLFLRGLRLLFVFCLKEEYTTDKCVPYISAFRSSNFLFFTRAVRKWVPSSFSMFFRRKHRVCRRDYVERLFELLSITICSSLQSGRGTSILDESWSTVI